MATIDDLVQSLHGNVHVSQEGYELKALQEYLSKTIILPPISPSTSYRPMAPSRSASSSRYPQTQTSASLPSDGSYQYQYQYQYPYHHQYPQASSNDMSVRPHSRPPHLRRSSSRAFANGQGAGPSSPCLEYQPFEGDAFAPLIEQETTPPPSDPWERIRQANEKQSMGARAGTTGFGFGQAFGSNNGATTNLSNSAYGFGNQNQSASYGFGIHGQSAVFGQAQHHQQSVYREEEDDDAMDAQMADTRMDDVDEEEAVEREMGLNWNASQSTSQQIVAGGANGRHTMWAQEEWARGRR